MELTKSGKRKQHRRGKFLMVQMDEADLDRLRNIAAKKDRTVSSIVRALLSNYMTKMERKAS